jgi:hypothetical protein
MNFGRLSFVFISLLLLPLSTRAATLYLDPVSAVIGPNDVFEVKVKLGTGAGECVNAANIVLNFPSEALEFKDFNSGDSIFSLWIERPGAEDADKINSEGKVIFSGGLPGGYCGKISGDPGDSNILGSAIFTAKKPVLFHKAGVDFAIGTELYLNDGQGTVAKMETQGMNTVIDESVTGTRDDWSQRINEDKLPPETFIIQISRDEKVADGRYFIVFSTTDKQTGIDHYEVLEANPADLVEHKEETFLNGIREKLFGVKMSPAAYERATSPYILKDQSLNSVIKVKAVDRAANELVVEYHNDALEKLIKMQNRPPVWPWAAGIAIAFILLSAVWMTILRIRRK